jgi:uncharacterized protein YecE (DUF72 family)
MAETKPPKSRSAQLTKAQLHIGPAGWSYKDWQGIVYPSPRPRGFHEATYLAEYFSTIEINTSFYQPLKPEHCRQWIERVSANSQFVFTAKLWQRFTHHTDATLEEERETRGGFDVLREAGKLGAILLQFPFSFHRTPDNVAYLKGLADRFRNYPLVVEVRHSSWNDAAFFQLLHEMSVGFCNIDQPLIGRSLKASEIATAPVGYIRLHGRRYDTWFSDDPELPSHERYNYLYSQAELAPWSQRIRTVEKSSRTTFVITNNHFEGKGVVNALQLINMLTRKKVKVPEPLRHHYRELDAIADEPPSEPTLFP